MRPPTACLPAPYRRPRRHSRRGTAIVELALLLPFLGFAFAIAVDYARIIYHSQTIENCARAGALYACDSVTAAQSPYSSIAQAALVDAANLSPQPTVTSMTGTDTAGNSYVTVTVAGQFRTITGFPGIPSTVNLSRSVRMRTVP